MVRFYWEGDPMKVLELENSRVVIRFGTVSPSMGERNIPGQGGLYQTRDPREIKALLAYGPGPLSAEIDPDEVDWAPRWIEGADIRCTLTWPKEYQIRETQQNIARLEKAMADLETTTPMIEEETGEPKIIPIGADSIAMAEKAKLETFHDRETAEPGELVAMASPVPQSRNEEILKRKTVKPIAKRPKAKKNKKRAA